MASEEIGEIDSSNTKGCSTSSCLIQVGYEFTMNEKDILDVDYARIFRVSKPLRDSDCFYSPNLVSIGPFHYGKKELEGMEKSKSEAVRRMQKRIEKKKDQQASMKSFVEEQLMFKDKEIKEFYGEDIPFPPIELAWIVARDACFVFEFLVNYVGWGNVGQRFYEEEVIPFSRKYDAVFDVSYQNPMRERLMNDILLLENQIPLWVLSDLLEIQMGSLEAAKQRMDVLMGLLLNRTIRQKVFMWYTPDSLKGYHILEVLYHGMVGNDVKDFKDKEALKLPSSSPSIVQICSEKGVDSVKAICGRWCKMWSSLPSSNTSRGEAVQLNILKLPTALELTRRGVKIRAVFFEERPRKAVSAIESIQFDEKTSTLYLPKIRVTLQSDLVMRNIIAMEVSTEKRYSPRPFTQFALFMDELMDGDEDVAVLRKAEVINNFLGSNQQVADLFNSISTGITPFEGCKVIDEARRKLHKYTRRKYKILWSEFVSAYFSKPWLVAGSMAAALLLLMTVAQVFCLFYTCSSKPS